MNRIKELEEILEENCRKLSEKEKKIAEALEDKVKNELSQLNMSNVDFKVDFNRSAFYAPRL